RFLSGSIARMAHRTPRDTVLAQDPSPSMQITLGREIHLLVSEGPEAQVVMMPDLIDKSLEAVQLILASMNVQAVPYKITRPGEEYEVVLGQHPQPGTVLIDGQEVTFDIRLRPTSFLPNARRKVSISYVVPLGATEVEVRVEAVDEAGRHKVIYPQISDYINNRPPLLLPGSTMTFFDIAYANETTIEFYIDRRRHRSYYYSGDNDPVITDHQATQDDTPKSANNTF
ncbi:MAG: PASTA domain-containing protein, partial [Candidatus Hydrogenedentota bacterium]